MELKKEIDTDKSVPISSADTKKISAAAALAKALAKTLADVPD